MADRRRGSRSRRASSVIPKGTWLPFRKVPGDFSWDFSWDYQWRPSRATSTNTKARAGFDPALASEVLRIFSNYRNLVLEKNFFRLRSAFSTLACLALSAGSRSFSLTNKFKLFSFRSHVLSNFVRMMLGIKRKSASQWSVDQNPDPLRSPGEHSSR
jgi:hypothetical protein